MASDCHKVFRLQGIPLNYYSRSDVRALVKTVLSIEAGAAVTVHSLAASPSQDNSRVATLSFRELPVVLSENAKEEWVVPLPIRDESDEDEEIPQKPLLFDTHFSGFTPLQRCDEDACNFDLIALSGRGGHAFGSFKERGGTFMWLRDALPHDLPNARILIYGYDTRVHRSNSFQNLTDLGRTLHVGIKGIRLSREGSYSARPIVFIGHSLGGLVLKEAIVKMKEEKKEDDVAILNATIAFIFFGVPHEGMAIESLVPLIKDQPNRGLLESLNKNSGFLQRLKNDFNSAFDAKRPPVVSFYETEKSPTAIEVEPEKWQLSGPLEVLVDVSSATYGSKYQHPINRSHSEMVKFTSHYDEVYGRVQLSLRPLVTGIQRITVAENMGTGVRECLRSLVFKEQDRRYHEIHSARGTCDWLLQDAHYQSWMNKERGLFWIKGNPGTGKSVLMKFAFTRMKERKSGELILSFFIHGRGLPLQRTPLGLFRSLLNSMLDFFPEHISELTEKFEEREKRFGSYHEKRWEWEEKELEEFISLVLTKGTKDRPMVIYIDALDECGETTAKSLLEYFKKLMSDIEREAGKVKICFSSRHYPVLGLNPVSTIFVENRNDDDIRYVIKELLSEVQPKEKRQRIEEEIFLKAQGGFQWAVLVADMAVEKSNNGMKAEKVHEKIKTIPEALEELYGDILRQVTQAEQSQTVKLFQWVLFAERPLSAQELREALATDKDMSCTTTSEMRNHQDWSDTIDEFETRVKYLSRGLVEFQTREFWEQYEVDGEDSDREAQFIHQSVPDYLLKNFLNPVGNLSGGQQSQMGAGHFEISRSCIRYLTLKDVLEQNHLPRGKLSAKFPLAPYAVQFFFNHIRKVDTEGILQLDLLKLIHWHEKSSTLRQIADLWKVLDHNMAHTPLGWPFIGATALHVVVAFGAHETFKESLQSDGTEVDGRDSEGNTPLMLAIREGHKAMAVTLLDSSVEWQSRYKTAVENESAENITSVPKRYIVNIEAENNDGDTPMALALMEQDSDLICRLLDASAGPEALARESQLIFHAIRTRHKPLLTKLIQKSVKLDGSIYFAVTQASGDDDDDIIEFIRELFEAGANTSRLESPDSNIYVGNRSHMFGGEGDGDAVLFAARRGHTAIIESLLVHGASVECRNAGLNTPLMIAVDQHNEDTVRLLLRRAPSIVDYQDSRDRTALWHALNRSSDFMAALLIVEGNASVVIGETDSEKALSVAAWKGLSKTVKAMLQQTNESTVKSVKQNWQDALRLAFDSHQEGTALLLIEFGDISTPFAEYDRNKTPLIRAIGTGLYSCFESILQKDKSTANFINDDGESVLGYALGIAIQKTALSQPYFDRILMPLIKNGDSSTFTNGPSGKTPLILASLQSGFHEVVNAILDKDRGSVGMIDQAGKCALHYAVKSRDEEKANLLIVEGHASTSTRDGSGKTPLILAVERGLVDCVKVMIAKDRSSVDLIDNNGMTALLYALRQSTDELAMLLITEGNASTKTADRAGRTPLIIAILRGFTAFVEALMRRDSSTISDTDEDGMSAFAYVAIMRNPEMERILATEAQAKLPNADTMISLARSHSLTFPQPIYCIPTATSIYPVDEAGKTLLVHAILSGDTKAVETFLSEGISSSFNVADWQGRTAVWYAFHKSNHQIFQLLNERVNFDPASAFHLSKTIIDDVKPRTRFLLDFPKVITDYPSQYSLKTPSKVPQVYGLPLPPGHPSCIELEHEIAQHHLEIPPLVVAAAYGREYAVSALLNTGRISSASASEACKVAVGLGFREISNLLQEGVRADMSSGLERSRSTKTKIFQYGPTGRDR